MEVEVKDSTIILPAKETPKHRLWMSNLDMLDSTAHFPFVYLYKGRTPDENDDAAGLARALKKALSDVLVAFYPLAGRLARDKTSGRFEIECNGEGAVFIEAQTSCGLGDINLDDFSTRCFQLSSLVPTIDSTKSSYPLVLQLTSFECGGVRLGILWHHAVADGNSVFHFINTWAEVTRGFPISIPPFIDRTILRTRVPPSPTFHHIEFDPPPSINTLTQPHKLQSSPAPTPTPTPTHTPTSVASLHLSVDQVNVLKAKLKKDHDTNMKISTYEILAAHTWRCMCKARGLSDDQPTKLHIPVDGRSRLNPPLPSGYFGNVVFTAAPLALAGDILSKPLIYTVEIIREALKRMDDEYLRSALAYMTQHDHDPTALMQGPHTWKSPNLELTSWLSIPTYEADFGWGRPVFMGHASLPHEGESYIVPSPSADKSCSLLICLETPFLQLFKELFYDDGNFGQITLLGGPKGKIARL